MDVYFFFFLENLLDKGCSRLRLIMPCKYNIKKSMGKPSAFLHILFHADDKSYENIETFGQNTYVNDVMLFLS